MEAAEAIAATAESEYEGVLSRTERAYVLTQSAAGNLADALAGNSEAFATVEAIEVDLDRLDREVDTTVSAVVGEITPVHARELLSCLKFMIDLERIGDLLASVATCARALGDRVSMDDVTDLVKMASVLERMLLDAHGALRGREVDRAMVALRSDAEMDRLRNLMMIRHLEQAQVRLSFDSLQVLFMAQALERAGDHVKNVAEEICHLVSGHTIRHLLRSRKKSGEQMYLEWLRNLHSLVKEDTFISRHPASTRSEASETQ